MELGEFKKTLSKGFCRLSHKTREHWPWKLYKKYARLTALIDYKCRFDGSDLCKRYKTKRIRKYTDDTNMCCCYGCARAFGHRSIFPKENEDLRILARHYNKKTGYWRKGKGCVLPRELRSVTCLTHKCTSGMRKIEKELLSALQTFADERGIPHFSYIGQYQKNCEPVTELEILERKLLRLKQNEEVRKTWKLLRVS